MEQSEDVQIRLQAFKKLKPWSIKRLKEFNSCCCNYDVQMAELKNGYNSMHIGHFNQNCMCTCDLCRPLGEVAYVANKTIVIGVQDMCD